MDLFARIDGWSRLQPDRTAHVSGSRTLTYSQLTAQSDAVAAYLSGQLQDDRSPVAIVGHKEPEMLVAFLGCAKAGHPYMPLDRSLPRTRVDDIVRVAEARFTLTPDLVREVAARPGESRNNPISPSEPCYIMFTSGSTGTSFDGTTSCI